MRGWDPFAKAALLEIGGLGNLCCDLLLTLCFRPAFHCRPPKRKTHISKRVSFNAAHHELKQIFLIDTVDRCHHTKGPCALWVALKRQCDSRGICKVTLCGGNHQHDDGTCIENVLACNLSAGSQKQFPCIRSIPLLSNARQVLQVERNTRLPEDGHKNWRICEGSLGHVCFRKHAFPNLSNTLFHPTVQIKDLLPAVVHWIETHNGKGSCCRWVSA
mmetsp:Transcript_51685/g.102770  ORF Transcript_51685/g.102770 Transcript_51685/m.102770 type:complete len:217 (+) Transcript_51685:2286-2936(+)